MSKGICPRCNTEMYCNSRGDYECRAFDCPPGSERKRKEDMDLGNELLAKLGKRAPAEFATASDLAYVVGWLNNYFPMASGVVMTAIMSRMRVEEKP